MKQEEPENNKWVAGRGYSRETTRVARAPHLRLLALFQDMFRSFTSRFSVIAKPAGRTRAEKSRSLVGAFVAMLEGPWGRLILVAVLLQLAYWLSAPVIK